MVEVLNEDIKNASVILLTLDSTNARFNNGVTKMIKQLEALFGTKMWRNTMIEMSKFPYDNKSINDRQYDCEQDPDWCHDEEYWKTEMNQQIEDKFHVGFDLPVVFIDSWAQKGPSNQNDPIQQEHFNEETDKLWKFALNSTPFQFKGIDEILEENDDLRNEVLWLNEEVRINITKLQQKDKDLEVDLMKMMPLGSIVAWVPKPDKAAADESEIPDGWMYCDGSKIAEGIWAGLHTPDLNNKNEFLRGGTEIDYLNHEDCAIQDLGLDLVKNEEKISHVHEFLYEWHDHDRCSDAGGGAFDKICNTNWHTGTSGKSGQTESSDMTITYAGVSLKQNDYRKADETRPINSKVIWIIRVQ